MKREERVRMWQLGGGRSVCHWLAQCSVWDHIIQQSLLGSMLNEGEDYFSEKRDGEVAALILSLYSWNYPILSISTSVEYMFPFISPSLFTHYHPFLALPMVVYAAGATLDHMVSCKHAPHAMCTGVYINCIPPSSSCAALP